jgi:hypothetical protein
MPRTESPSERHRVRVLEQERATGVQREPRLEGGAFGVQAVVEDEVEVLALPAVVAQPRVQGDQVSARLALRKCCPLRFSVRFAVSPTLTSSPASPTPSDAALQRSAPVERVGMRISADQPVSVRVTSTSQKAFHADRTRDAGSHERRRRPWAGVDPGHRIHTGIHGGRAACRARHRRSRSSGHSHGPWVRRVARRSVTGPDAGRVSRHVADRCAEVAVCEGGELGGAGECAREGKTPGSERVRQCTSRRRYDGGTHAEAILELSWRFSLADSRLAEGDRLGAARAAFDESGSHGS